METNRILAQKKKQSEDASIKLNTNLTLNGQNNQNGNDNNVSY